MLNFPNTIPELADALKVQTQELLFFVSTIDKHVREKKKPKPNGEFRTITKPLFKLKTFLQKLDHSLLHKLELHPLLYLRPGSSHIEMIKYHQKSQCLITADIDDFYPTIKPHMVLRELVGQGFNQEIAKILTRLVTVNHSLPQGFPTSSTIAAIVIKPVAVRLDGLQKAANLRIGLYADNLAISANYDARKFENLAKKIFYQNGFNLDKFIVMNQSTNQELMNIITNDGLRVKSGYYKEVKNEISHLSKIPKDQNQEFSKKFLSVQGKLNYVNDINDKQALRLKDYAHKLGLTKL
ncbi:MAG: hypothetical protein HY089_04340 [Ignavibacteriales bacterium]|nr:hypothetical protein [Ignavibacteriales bacterium]